jgi:hypothetical protein
MQVRGEDFSVERQSYPISPKPQEESTYNTETNHNLTLLEREVNLYSSNIS